MEHLLIRVQTVTRGAPPGTWVAQIRATSSARVYGHPEATIELRLVLPPVPGEHHAGRLQRAKDESLRYLDCA